ncbi:hypothetical protein [Pseudomonas phage PA_LZ03]|nr:hypothetical protein [Pseudomonas phage PA_LZ03]
MSDRFAEDLARNNQRNEELLQFRARTGEAGGQLLGGAATRQLVKQNQEFILGRVLGRHGCPPLVVEKA